MDRGDGVAMSAASGRMHNYALAAFDDVKGFGPLTWRVGRFDGRSSPGLARTDRISASPPGRPQQEPAGSLEPTPSANTSR